MRGVPRSTSYPTAADFVPLGPDDYERQLALARMRSDEPCAAYIHVPFCAKRCNFCACSVVASPELSHWQYAIERGELATARGIVRTAEDRLRAAVIEDLMCHHTVERERITERFGIDFDQHFAGELAELAQAEFDGLVVDCPEGLELTEVGRLFVRNIAMVFDERLRTREATIQRFSATV